MPIKQAKAVQLTSTKNLREEHIAYIEVPLSLPPAFTKRQTAICTMWTQSKVASLKLVEQLKNLLIKLNSTEGFAHREKTQSVCKVLLAKANKFPGNETHIDREQMQTQRERKREKRERANWFAVDVDVFSCGHKRIKLGEHSTRFVHSRTTGRGRRRRERGEGREML